MKLKRLFTAILSAALTLSLCAMPAMATEGGTTAGTPLADGMPVWDTTKKGSITIHKFEYNPTSGAPTGYRCRVRRRAHRRNTTGRGNF